MFCDKFCKIFYKIKNIPIHNNIIYSDSEEAYNCTKGDIFLTFCKNCGMIFNSDFDINLLNYGDQYDNRQSYSKYYRNYSSNLIKNSIKIFYIKGLIMNTIMIYYYELMKKLF